MSNTHLTLRDLISAIFMVIGIALFYSATDQDFRAQVTSQGAEVKLAETPGTLNLEPATFHAAAVDDARSNTAAQIVLGMILILVGFSLHAFMTMRDQPRKKSEKKKGKNDLVEFFWYARW